MTTKRIACALSLGVSIGLSIGGAAACDSKDKPPMDKAFDRPAPQDSKAEAAAADKARKKAAEAAAEKARTDELERATALPATLPPDLETACADVGVALDEFKTSRLTGDEAGLGRWNATKEPDMRKAVETCTASAKIEVGACTAAALRTASRAFFMADDAGKLADRCRERWGGAAAAPAG